jgi:group I intron endonuclease
MESGIYTITNLANNKVLVGQSINIKNRLRAHKVRLKQGIHENKHLQRAWDDYGENFFEFKPIEYIEKEFLLSHELYWSNMLDSHNFTKGYNLKSCSPTGYGHHSQETKNKIGASHKGRKLSEDHKNKLRIAHTGKPLSNTHKSNIKSAMTGRTLSEGHKLACSIAFKLRAYKPTEEQKARAVKAMNEASSKPIIDLLTNTVYSSIRECMQRLNISYSALQYNLAGKGQKLKQFKLKYYAPIENGK